MTLISIFVIFPQHASVTLLVHTVAVMYVIRTADNVFVDLAPEEGNAISALQDTTAFLIVDVSRTK